ncbi:hypothetical protein [Streptomyces silvisoli]|uniref:Acetyltransferase n=1 Tax=Streptomyces silvisoli TaxID=3034235 RepID=A0ABT5ZS42_9ACTN|nr:hypothetical protein [Streptomyces silvisoli]MDF3292650.1 hypothetical protein [Streptomyces silvisoli]
MSLVCQGSGVAGTSPANLPRQLPAWVVVERRDPTIKSPCVKGETSRMLAAYRDFGYRTVSEENGIVMSRKPASR